MDLVGYDKSIFNAIKKDYHEFANSIGIKNFISIPISGLNGDNITMSSNNTSWYKGITLMKYLESVELNEAKEIVQDFRMPVQWVNRPNLDFRGFSGKIVTGSIKKGDEIRVLPSGSTSYVDRIVTFDGDLDVGLQANPLLLHSKMR